MSTVDTNTPERQGRRKRRMGIFFGVLATLMGGTIAFAAWTSQGTGSSGQVTAGTTKSLVITQGASASGLTPGSSTNSTYTITNPNTYPVTVTSIAVNSIAVTGGTGTPLACTSANSLVTATAGTGTVSIIIPSLGTSAAQTITLTMGADSANGCQGAVFVPNITATTN